MGLQRWNIGLVGRCPSSWQEDPNMTMTQERTIVKGQAQLDEMVAFVRQAAEDGRPIDEVERGLWQSLLTLGHTMLTAYVEGLGAELR